VFFFAGWEVSASPEVSPFGHARFFTEGKKPAAVSALSSGSYRTFCLPLAAVSMEKYAGKTFHTLRINT
jgi:hypothetical protein